MKINFFYVVILLIKYVKCVNYEDISVSSTEANYLYNGQFARSRNQTDDIVSTIYSTVASVSKELSTGATFNSTYDVTPSSEYAEEKQDQGTECRGIKSEIEFIIRPSQRICDFLVKKNHSGICSLELTLLSWNGDCRESWLEAGGRLECGMLTGTRTIYFERNTISLKMRSLEGVLVVKQTSCTTQVTPPSVFTNGPTVPIGLKPQDPQYPAHYIPPNLRPATLPPDHDRQTFPFATYTPPTNQGTDFPNNKNTVDNEISHNKIDSLSTVHIPNSKYPVLISQPSSDPSSAVYRPPHMFPGMSYGRPDCDKNTGVVVSTPGYPNFSPASDCTLVLYPSTRLCSPFIYFDYFEFGNPYGSSCQNTFFEIGGYRLCGCLSGMSWRVPDFIFSSDRSLKLRFRGQGRLLLTIYFNTCQSYNPYPPSQRQSWRCQQLPYPGITPRPNPFPYPTPVPRPMPSPQPLWPPPSPTQPPYPQPFPEPAYPPKQPPPQPPFPYPPRQPSPQPPFPYPPRQPSPQPPFPYPPKQPPPQPPFPYPPKQPSPQPPLPYPPQPRPDPPFIYPPQQPKPQPPYTYPPQEPRPQPPSPQPFPRPYPVPTPPPYPVSIPEPNQGCKIIRVPQGSINCAPLQPQYYCYRFEPPRGYCQMVIRLDEVSMSSSQNCYNEYLTTGIRDPRICQENIPMYVDRGGYLQGKLMGGSSVRASFQGLPCSCNVDYRQVDFVLRGTPSQDNCQYNIHKFNEGVCSLELTLDSVDLQCGVEALMIDGKSYCGFRANERIEVPFLEPLLTVRYVRHGQPSKPGSFSINVLQKSRCVQSFSSATGRDIKYREDCSQPLTGVYGNLEFPGATRNSAQYSTCTYDFQPKQGYCFVRMDFDEVEVANSPDCNLYYIQINGIKYCGNTLSFSTKVLVLDEKFGAMVSYKPDRSARWRFTFSLLPCRQEILARAQNIQSDVIF